MPAVVQATSDHPLKVIVPGGDEVMVYNRKNSDFPVYYDSNGPDGHYKGTLEPDKAVTLTTPGTYFFTCQGRADLKLFGGQYG